jgi:hypothetical protein
MKLFLIFLGALVAIIVLMIVIGAFLPKGHVATVRAKFNEPADKIWHIVADFAAWPSWNPSAKKMERLPDRDGHPVWLMIGKDGRLPTEVMESRAPGPTQSGRLVTRFADPSLPFSGSWTMSFEPAADGSTLTITEDGEVRNLLFRFMSRFVFGHTGTLEAFLTSLGKKVGEDVTPIVEAR